MRPGASSLMIAWCAVVTSYCLFSPMTHAQSTLGAELAAVVPDLSGVWQRSSPGFTLTAEEPPMTALGQERFSLARPGRGATANSGDETNAPDLQCTPMGIPATYFRPRPIEIIQLPDRVIMLLEVENFFRIIYTDGREFPDFPLPTWNGYAIGHYEDDALVIETRNFRGWESEERQRWLDRLGHPFSDELTVIERIRRVDDDTLENEITIVDPVTYERPWAATMTFSLREGIELVELICSETDNRAFAEFERQILEYGREEPQ